MFRHFITLCVLPSFLLASDAPLQSREMSIKDIQAQNKEIAKLAAAEISKSLPQNVDKYTKLLSCKADNTTLIYTYELDIKNKSDEEIKKNDYERMKKAVTLGSCKSSKRFLDADISLKYIYKSAKTKADLFNIDVDKKSCVN